MENRLLSDHLDAELMWEAKRMGFSDWNIGANDQRQAEFLQCEAYAFAEWRRAVSPARE